jgi:type IV secretion system protein VirD4
MLGPGPGLFLGRTLGGQLIRVQNYCHVLLVGGTGSGKGVGVVIPNALAYRRGSLVVHDPKGDLRATVGERRRRRGDRVIDLAPFDGGADRLNPLDGIPADSPLLVDHARSIAESLVVRGAETDPHWNDRAAQAITALLVYVLLRLSGPERSLTSVQEIASDPDLMAAAAARLRATGGIPARLGGQLKTLFAPEGGLSKEGASVVGVVGRHLAFLDSGPVAWAVAESTFSVRGLLSPGVVLFVRVPPSQLEAQRGLLRCWFATLFREIGAAGAGGRGEVLCLLDEASALANLGAVEEMLVRGRSAGCRLLLAYQSDSQVRAAFKDKPTLIHDNCDTQLYLGGANGYEQAERLSKMIGDHTLTLESRGENSSYSYSSGHNGQGGGQSSRGHSTNHALHGRALLRPEEVLRLGDDFLLAFHRGLPAPILGRRLKWYADPAFNPAAKPPRAATRTQWAALALAALALGGVTVRARVYGYGYWQPVPAREVRRGEDRGGESGGGRAARAEGVEERLQPVPGQRGRLGDRPVRDGDPGGDRGRPRRP